MARQGKRNLWVVQLPTVVGQGKQAGRLNTMQRTHFLFTSPIPRLPLAASSFIHLFLYVPAPSCVDRHVQHYGSSSWSATMHSSSRDVNSYVHSSMAMPVFVPPSLPCPRYLVWYAYSTIVPRLVRASHVPVQLVDIDSTGEITHLGLCLFTAGRWTRDFHVPCLDVDIKNIVV